MAGGRAFIDFQTQAFGLYQEGRLEEALEIVRTRAGEFPAEAAHTYNWEMCMLARLGRTGEALETLRQALDAGVWWSESSLRGDPDLEPLLGLAAFDRMIEESEGRKAAAQAESRPEIFIYGAEAPAGASPASPLLIALHGRNSRAEVHAPFWTAPRQQGWTVAMPQSSQLIDYQSRCWDDAAQAEQEILTHYQNLAREGSLDSSRLVLGGFSQGGGLAIRLGLAGKLPLCGLIAAAPWLPDAAELGAALTEKHLDGLKVVLVFGEQDPVTDNREAIEALIREQGAALCAVVVPGLGHMYPDEFDEMLLRGLEFICE